MFFLLQNIFITFSRHNYGKTEWDVALTWKEKSGKYFTKNMLLMHQSVNSSNAHPLRTILGICKIFMHWSGPFVLSILTQGEICTFHIILSWGLALGMAWQHFGLVCWPGFDWSYHNTSIYQKCLKKNILLVFISLYVCI